MGKQRDSSLDLMRFIGVLSVMIAHAGPPEWFFQVRNFATPLLIVASALTFGVIYKTRELDVVPFLKRRFSRLLFPTWIFLFFFFGVFLLYSTLSHTEFPFSMRKIAATFTLYGGIGYVWIFKVYLILALITPLALKVDRAITSIRVYYLLIAMFYLMYELALMIFQPMIPDKFAGFFREVIFTIVPYALLYLYGLKLGRLSNRQILSLTLLPFLAFVGLAIYKTVSTGSFVPTQVCKRPPTIYYLSYAMIWINFIYMACRRYTRSRVKVIEWISSNSLWIYLWHIFAVYLVTFTIGMPEGCFFPCLGVTAFLTGFGIIMCFIQRRVVGRYLFNRNNKVTDWLARQLI